LRNAKEAVVIPRSYLYVPGNAPAKLEKALHRGADAVIVDLEDAVPAAAKQATRLAVADWLSGLSGATDVGVQVWVRINPGAAGHEDARAVLGSALTGVMVAKTESPAELDQLDAVLAETERDRGLVPGSIQVVPLIESAAAMLSARDIAGAPRVARLQVGEADLAADTGITPSEDEREWATTRAMVVLVSAAAGLLPPVAPVSTNFQDLDRLAGSTRALARQGYVGRACIHPDQIPVVNAVFTPTAEEVAAAAEVVARFDEAIAEGSGVIVGPDGRMVDEAVVRQARRVLGLAR
jgi:citrate lyase subunit beta/citryl-CoA lyase